MEYRRLGDSGIKVSALSYGSWVTFKKQLDFRKAVECMNAAYEGGVNFFDNAEIYARGDSEILMGEAIGKLGWRRSSYLVSTKLFWGLNESPNEKNTLNRKYLLGAIGGSLKRLQLDYVDLLYCHRPDPETPIIETVWAMNDLINRGYALYWGTSEWSAAQIEEAFVVAEREHLRRPTMEQPQYNLLARERVEREYKDIFAKRKIGATTWSPLASGMLTGKYKSGIPAGSRLGLEGFEWLKEQVYTEEAKRAVLALEGIAKDCDSTLAPFSIAWCLKNPNVSSVILGATKIDQLRENLKALSVMPKLTPEIMARIDKALNN